MCVCIVNYNKKLKRKKKSILRTYLRFFFLRLIRNGLGKNKEGACSAEGAIWAKLGMRKSNWAGELSGLAPEHSESLGEWQEMGAEGGNRPGGSLKPILKLSSFSCSHVEHIGVTAQERHGPELL